MFATALSILLSSAPALYKLFTSDDKSEATKELTMNVVKTAATKLGVPLNTKEDLLQEIAKNPDVVVKLKELENHYALEVEELKLEDKKLDFDNEQKQEENRTERWKSDNSADSRFAKLLRPGLTAYLVLIVTILAILDGNVGSFTIKEVWVSLFTLLCSSSVGGYFVLRTYEKRTGTSVWKR